MGIGLSGSPRVRTVLDGGSGVYLRADPRRPAMPTPSRREPALDRFLRYARIDTQSKEGVEAVPSTRRQLVLSRLLRDELREMGARGVRLDAHGYVYARIPATLP